MKKIFTSIFALVAICSSAFAQDAPFEWQAGENTKVKLGGFIRFNTYYDTKGNMGGANDFKSNKIPAGEVAWDEQDLLNCDATASRLSIQVTQSTKELGDIKAFAEFDFRNSGGSARLRQAYVEMLGVTAGFAWSFMSDLAANAPTVDIMGVSSRTFLRSNLIGYRHNFDKNLSAGISLEIPSLASTYAADFTNIDQTIPNLPFYIQHKSAAGHIKVGGMLRALQYGYTVDKSRETALGWGAQASGSYNLSKSAKLFGQAIYGEGINNFINDIAGESVGMMLVDNTMEATPMGGFSVGALFKFAKSWSVAASGSIVENYGDKNYFMGNYQSSSYINASLFYNPVPKLTLGVEGICGARTNFGGEAHDASRVSMMIKYAL